MNNEKVEFNLIESETGLWSTILLTEKWYIFVVRTDLISKSNIEVMARSIDKAHKLLISNGILIALQLSVKTHWQWSAELESKELLFNLRRKGVL